jgi:phage terminase large subunit-like protein
MKPERPRFSAADLAQYLKSLGTAARRNGIALLGPQERDSLDRAWEAWAHDGQLAPPGEWSTWVIKAGRGFGKTVAGAQWIASLVAHGEALSFALVGATLEDARRVMVEGKSGLIEVAAGWVSDWEPSLGRLSFRTGASAQLFSGASPDRLRGPEHHYAWCDELAKWDKPQATWDMLQLGLRLGTNPRTVVTTTPRSGPVLSAIMDDPDTVVTGGSTLANPHTSASYKRRVTRLYAGTRLGRQEIDGEMLPDAAGALWTVELLERCRVPAGPFPNSVCVERSRDNPPSEAEASSEGSRLRSNQSLDCARDKRKWERVLIAVDPPTVDGTCGIIACAREGEAAHSTIHILADHSVTARSPEGWAGAVAAAAAAHGTREVVAEANQGGKMVKAVLQTADPDLRVRLVNAHTGKSARAEPVAHLFEAGRVRLHGRMPELEAQLQGMIAGGGYEGPGQSPDRADAMVWGVSELMKERAVVRVRGL